MTSQCTGNKIIKANQRLIERLACLDFYMEYIYKRVASCVSALVFGVEWLMRVSAFEFIAPHHPNSFANAQRRLNVRTQQLLLLSDVDFLAFRHAN
jgi:hypothetical protein